MRGSLYLKDSFSKLSSLRMYNFLTTPRLTEDKVCRLVLLKSERRKWGGREYRVEQGHVVYVFRTLPEGKRPNYKMGLSL